MTIATGILVLAAMAVGGTLAAAVIYAVVTCGRDWWREFLSVRLLPFVLVGMAVAATTLGIGFASKSMADDALRDSVSDIEDDCDDQMGILLHSEAVELADKLIGTNRLPRVQIQAYADYCQLAEFTIVGRDGRIVDTTDPGAKVGDPFFTDEEKHAPYRRLLDGRSTTVRQRFRQSATSADRVIKYFAMALPQGGFIQVGFLWEDFERAFAYFFLPIFESRTVGESGFCIVLDRNDAVSVNAPGHPDVRGRSAAEIGFTAANLAVPLGRVFRARLFGTLYRCMAYPECVAGHRIYAVVPLSERQGPALALAFGVASVLLAVFLGFKLVMRKFRQQQARIDALRAADEERRAADLALARAVQRGELRTDGMRGDGYRLRALMDAAREVGGDFYDYYTLRDGRLALTIADVSGKGIPAALFMMKSRTTLKSCVCECASLAEAVAAANVLLSQKNPAELFVTAWVGVWDPKTGALEYVSAGHNPPLVRRADGRVEWIAAPRAPALGVFERAKYRSATVALGPGDGVFLYTDGVTEAMDTAGELFGNARLEAALHASEYPLVPAVIDALGAFTAGADQADDITMLEMQVEPDAGK